MFNYAHLFAPYRSAHLEWEGIVLVRRTLCMFCVVVLIQYGPYVQLLVTQLVLVTSLAFHVQFQPYAHAAFNRLELVSISSSCLTLWAAVFLADGSDGSVHTLPLETFTVVVLLVNLALFG